MAKHESAEAATIVAMLVAHLRSTRSKVVSPMTLGPPTEPIRDHAVREGADEIRRAKALLDAALSYTEQSPQWPSSRCIRRRSTR